MRVITVISVCAWTCTGEAKTPPKQRRRKWHLSNAAWAPGKYAHTHTQRDGDDDNDGALSGLGVRASREQESCVQWYAPRIPYKPAAVALAASAVVVAAVVVELDAEAQTGSRRSMMTDDSRPSIYASNVLRRAHR